MLANVLSRTAGFAVGLAGIGSVAMARPDGATGDEVRAIVAEMLADAQTRSSLAADGATAGRDEKGFFLSDGSGKFRLQIGGAIQFRYNLNFRDSNSGGPNAAANRGNDDFESGFQTRRTRIWTKGTIVAPELFYGIQGDFSRSTGDFSLLDAYAGYKAENGCYAKWGQFKLPFLREELLEDWKQLAAERSGMNQVFTQDRSQAVEIGRRDENFSLALAFSDGFNSKNSEFGSTNGLGNFGFVRGGGESDWAFTGRVEWKVKGDWKQFEDFTSKPGSDYACMLGAAGHVERSANDIAANVGGIDTQGDTTYGAWTVDMSVEGDGWNLFAAGTGAHQQTSLANGFGHSSSDDYGLVVQGGFYIPDTDWELFGRYDAVFQDSGRGAEEDTFDTITVGTTYYYAGHAAKFIFDVQWFLDPSQPLMGSNVGNNFLATTNEGEVNVRLQFQLLF